MSFLPGAHDKKEACRQEEDYEDDYPQATVCVEEPDEELDASGELTQPALKVFISPGTVLAYNPKDAAQLLWKQEVSVFDLTLPLVFRSLNIFRKEKPLPFHLFFHYSWRQSVVFPSILLLLTLSLSA